MSGLDIALLAVLLLASVWVVMGADLMRAVLALALGSVILTMLLFRFSMPLAGVFELSVCAGLVTVVFISAISLMPIQNPDAIRQAAAERWRRYVWLPLLLAGAALWLFSYPSLSLTMASPSANQDVRAAIWLTRRFDLVGQMLVILSGVYGVVVFFKFRPAAAKNGNEDDK